MALNVTGILNALVSHAQASGLFERVNTHEPKNAPGHGLTAAVWADRVEPARANSGLQATTARVVFQIRLFADMLQEPQDAIDPNVLTALDELLAAYSGDFDLGGMVRNVDLLGQAGTPLFAQAGYINVSGHLYRVMTISLPLIVNDAWEQQP